MTVRSVREKNPSRARSATRIWGITAFMLIDSGLAVAAGGSLAEVETTATWVLNIFSPTLLLVFLTLLLIGCGLAVYLGRMGGQMFMKIMVGSVLVFGARSIAPKIIGLF